MLGKLFNLRNRLKKLNRIEQREGYYQSLIEQNLPEYLKFDESILWKVREQIKRQFGFTAYPELIHKNDIMFHYHLLQLRGEMMPALFSHFAVGAGFVFRLHQFLLELDFQPRRILDFGSGYGRVSRFLPLAWPKAEISVSEVKHEAMDFQEKALKFHTIRHTQDPDSFNADSQDLIIALSVFSHLPEPSFVAWFTKLGNQIGEGGRLVFSYNPLQHKAKQGQTFHYISNSEDLHFPKIQSAISNPDEYGLAYIARSFIASLANSQGLNTEFLENRLTPGQEMVMVSRMS